MPDIEVTIQDGDDLTVVITPDADTIEVTVEDETISVEVTDMGPQGAKGDKGDKGDPGTPANASYVHQQASASAEWVITHNLGFYPSVTVFDSAGTWVIGDIEHINNNQVKLIFSAPFGGVAYLS